MLCPEVWDFKAPKATFNVQKLLDTEENLCSNNTISKFYYNHLVSIVIPDALRIPQSLTEKLISDCEYYKILSLNLSDLINQEFIEGFVRKGNTILLSVNTRIDCDICVAVTPTGSLVIALDKDTYQALGLEGRSSHFTEKLKNRYIVTLDLTAKDLQPSKPRHKKVQKALRYLPNFDVIVSWEPPEKDICPSSIAKYFSDIGYGVKCCEPSANSSIIYSVKVPELNIKQCGDSEVAEFAEWLGMVSLNADLQSGEGGNYVNTYETPEPNTEAGPVRFLQWRGLFTSNQVKGLLQELRDCSLLEGKPWIAVYVQGFSDSPVAWGLEEHHYYTHGDNGYIAIFNKKDSLFCMQKCSKKRYK